MGYENKKNRSKNTDSFARLNRWVMRCEAYRSLSIKARALYNEFLYRYRGDNNGEILMSVRMAADAINTSNNTASKAIKELEYKGFIKCAKKGAFSLKRAHGSEWIINEYQYKGKSATKEFARWKK